MNNVILMGRLTAAPDLKKTQTGTDVLRLTLAIDRRMSKEKATAAKAANQPTADFPSVIMFGPTAATAAQYLEKGRQILVQGRIQTRTYVAQDGTKRYATEVVADHFEFADAKNPAQATTAPAQAAPAVPVYAPAAQAPAYAPAAAPAAAPALAGFEPPF